MSSELNNRLVKSLGFTQDEEENILASSLNMMDQICNMATNIILNTVRTTSCSEAKRTILKNPELLALRALQKTIDTIIESQKTYHGPRH